MKTLFPIACALLAGCSFIDNWGSLSTDPSFDGGMRDGGAIEIDAGMQDGGMRDGGMGDAGMDEDAGFDAGECPDDCALLACSSDEICTADPDNDCVICQSCDGCGECTTECRGDDVTDCFC